MRPETLSIVVPAYNEAGRIDRALAQIDAFARAHAEQRVQAIIVDDGSSDATAAIVERFPAGPAALRLIRHERNLGKGAAVRTGMRAAIGDAVLFCDADMATPLDEVARLLPALGVEADVVIGSRVMSDSLVDPPQPLLRRLLGHGFRRVRRALILPDIRDTQCGFKLFTAPAARAVFAETSDDGFAFDCEVLLLAQRRGLRIAERGVRWASQGDSTLRLRDAPKMFAALLKIRRRVNRLPPP